MSVTIHEVKKQFHRTGDWVNKFQCEHPKGVFFHGDFGEYHRAQIVNDVSQIICDGWQVTWNTITDGEGLSYQKFGMFFLTEYDADGVMSQLLMGVIPDARKDS